MALGIKLFFAVLQPIPKTVPVSTSQKVLSLMELVILFMYSMIRTHKNSFSMA